MDVWFVVVTSGFVIVSIAAIVAGWGCCRLLLDRGRLLLRVEALETQLGAAATPVGRPATGLPIGTVVPDFELADLSGRYVARSSWRGRRVLLIFVDPACHFSRQCVSALAELPANLAEDFPERLLISTGDPEENRRLVEADGLRCPLLLQEEREVARLYDVDATPVGYLLDEHGVTVSAAAVGTPAILALAVGPPEERRATGGVAAAANPSGDLRAGVTPIPPAPRVNRDGLTAGATAPDFRLPLLEGGELALADFRGRQFLLIFADPFCPACSLLLTNLARNRGFAPTVDLLIVSRGDPAINREMVATHRLTCPVVLQRHREVARAYGMFATPAGYLIDEMGKIATPVAVGAAAIQALANEPKAISRGSRRKR